MSEAPLQGVDAKKSSVRRVNDRPLYILGAVAGLFLFIMMLVAFERAEKETQKQEPGESQKNGPANPKILLSQITQGHVAGIIEERQEPSEPLSRKPPKAPGPVSQKAQGALLEGGEENALSEDFLAPPEAWQKRLFLQKPSLDTPDKAFKNDEKKQEALLEALKISSRVSASFSVFQTEQNTPVAREATETLPENPSQIYLRRMAEIKSLIPGSGENPPARKKGFSDFDNKGAEGERWTLSSTPDAFQPCVVRAGSVIPAILLSAINSDLPGTIMAQVSQNIYDSTTGRCLVIAQGARLTGSYDSDVAYAQSRLLIAWQRVLLPDGRALDIGAMPGADASGQSGLADSVDNHYFRIFGSALLMSTISAGFNYGKKNVAPGSPESFSGAFGDAARDRLGEATAGILSKNINISPTLFIRPGFRMNVIVTKDIRISPFPDPSTKKR